MVRRGASFTAENAENAEIGRVRISAFAAFSAVAFDFSPLPWLSRGDKRKRHRYITSINHIVPNAYRVGNRLDVVPKVPPPLMYFHVGDETELLVKRDRMYLRMRFQRGPSFT